MSWPCLGQGSRPLDWLPAHKWPLGARLLPKTLLTWLERELSHETDWVGLGLQGCLGHPTSEGCSMGVTLALPFCSPCQTHADWPHPVLVLWGHGEWAICRCMAQIMTLLGCMWWFSRPQGQAQLFRASRLLQVTLVASSHHAHLHGAHSMPPCEPELLWNKTLISGRSLWPVGPLIKCCQRHEVSGKEPWHQLKGQQSQQAGGVPSCSLLLPPGAQDPPNPSAAGPD